MHRHSVSRYFDNNNDSEKDDLNKPKKNNSIPCMYYSQILSFFIDKRMQ